MSGYFVPALNVLGLTIHACTVAPPAPSYVKLSAGFSANVFRNASLTLVTAVIHERIVEHMASAQRRITGGHEPVSSSALALLLQTCGFGLVLNDLLADSSGAVSESEFAGMLRAFLAPLVPSVPTRS